jgi:hypothetical protein
VLEISPRAAAGTLLPLLQPASPGLEQAQIQRLLENRALWQQICLQVLGEGRASPEIAQRVGAVYEQESRMMDGGIWLLLVGALVVLAINLKEIHIVAEKNEKGESKKDFKISFRRSGEAVKSFLMQLLKVPGAGL